MKEDPSASKLKDGIDNVVVALDKKDPVFSVGEKMTGHVVVFCNETTAVRGVKIKFLGRMTLHWREIDGGTMMNYREFEDYLDEELTVWAPKPHNQDEMWMFPGQHTYPFEFELPVDLPETLEDARYAKVIYQTKASVHLIGNRVSHSLEEPFYLISCPDPDKILPTEEELPKENWAYGEIGGSCWTKKAQVELGLKLDKSVYKLGDTIDIHAECRVEGGFTDVKKLIAVLVQEAVYIVSPMTKGEARKKERLVMAEAVDEEDADAGQTQAYELKLEIDEKLPLTDYPWCDFIHMGYFVHVIARTSGFYDDVVCKLPIVIQPRDENEAVNAAMEELEQLQEEQEEEEKEENEEENEEEEENDDDNDEEDKKEDDEEEAVDEILSGDYDDL